MCLAAATHPRLPLGRLASPSSSGTHSRPSPKSQLLMGELPTLERAWASLGRPASPGLQHAAHGDVDGRPLLAVASAGNVSLLDARLDIVMVLPFWEAFPSTAGYDGAIACVCFAPRLDAGPTTLAAALGPHVAVWTVSKTPDGLRSRVHSTFTERSEVTSLDLQHGVMLVGSRSLSIWRLDETTEIPMWSRQWTKYAPSSVSVARFSPDGQLFASAVKGGACVSIWDLATPSSPSITSRLRHARPVVDLSWRKRPQETSQARILFTRTSQGAAFVFGPVVDQPDVFQLWTSVDPASFDDSPSTSDPFGSPGSVRSREALGCADTSSHDDVARSRGVNTVHWWDASDASTALTAALRSLDTNVNAGGEKEGDEQQKLAGSSKRLQHFLDDGPDFFFKVGQDGSLVVKAVANIDRRPPTLLQAYTVLRLRPTAPLPANLFAEKIHFVPLVPPAPTGPSWPNVAMLLQGPSTGSIVFFSIVPTLFFEGDARGLYAVESIGPGVDHLPPSYAVGEHLRSLDGFTRTDNGGAIVSVAEEGEAIIWSAGFTPPRVTGRRRRSRLRPTARWRKQVGGLPVALFDDGDGLAAYDGSSLALWRRRGIDMERAGVLEPWSAEAVPAMLLALTEDSTAGGVRTSYLIASTAEADVFLWRISRRASTGAGEGEEKGEGGYRIDFISRCQLLAPEKVDAFVSSPDENGGGWSEERASAVAHPADVIATLPVDPMGWHQSAFVPATAGASRKSSNDSAARLAHDVLVAITADGVLSFWTPDLRDVGEPNGAPSKEVGGWQMTGAIHTGRTKVTMARCSSFKKTALVCRRGEEEEELTIWDSRESEFASGLEHIQLFRSTEEAINDLDWTSTADLQSILAVGFRSTVLFLCPKRLDYFEASTGGPASPERWETFVKVDISGLTPNPISDSIWLSSGSLAVGSSNQVFVYSRFLAHKAASGAASGEMAAASEGHKAGADEAVDIFELVARRNGPVPDWHPQLVLQCLLLGKLELVKRILFSLSEALQEAETTGDIRLRQVPTEAFYEESSLAKTTGTRPAFQDLLDGGHERREEDETTLGRRSVDELVKALERRPLPHLSAEETARLGVLAQTTLEVDEQSRALDANGLRYLVSMRSLLAYQQLASRRSSSSSPNMLPTSSVTFNALHDARLPTRRAPDASGRLRHRDMVWAYHSESQKVLLSAVLKAVDGKMTWEAARQFGVFVWLRSHEALRAQMELVARAAFQANSDPVACSLFYFALRKKKLVYGLWKQAAWHPEQAAMLKFLAHDFEQERWRTAAMKNAYALMGKGRFEYAAAFFLLGGSVEDSVNVIVRQLGDLQLAIAVARVYEGRDDGRVLEKLLKSVVLPMAFENGYRWIGSWAFWMLNRRDLAVRIIVTPLSVLVQEPSLPLIGPRPQVGEPNYDDPSLAILYSQLKDRSLQTVKGTAEISERTEFNFVLQMARVLCRMGCHPLAVSLVRNWPFDRPTTPTPTPQSSVSASASVSATASTVGRTEEGRAASPTVTTSKPAARRPPSARGTRLLHRRRSTVVDMELPASESETPMPSGEDDDGGGGVSPTRSRTTTTTTTPTTTTTGASASLAVDAAPRSPGTARQSSGLGNLLRSAKQEAKSGGHTEFDFSAFDM